MYGVDDFNEKVFQSSPAPEGECNGSTTAATTTTIPFQSSPAPEGECNRVGVRRSRLTPVLSILTHT